MKYYTFILLGFFLFSCSNYSEEYKLLQGDWNIIHDGRYPMIFGITGYTHFSGDSVLWDNNIYEKYNFKDDTLFIWLDEPYQNFYEGFKEYEKYFILHLSKDSLALEHVEKSISKNKYVYDTTQIYLNRFEPIENQAKLIRVEYASGWCFGNCPQKDVVIDSSGYFYYGPQEYDSVDRPYTSKSEKELFKKISLLTSTIPVSRFDSLNGVGIDAQVLRVNFYFEDGIKKQITADRMSPLLPVFTRLDFSHGFANSLTPSKPLKLSVRDSLNSSSYY